MATRSKVLTRCLTIAAAAWLAGCASRPSTDPKEAEQQGKGFARSSIGRGCLEEALARNKLCPDVSTAAGAACITASSAFFEGCAENAPQKQTACPGALPPGVPLDVGVDAWCAKHGQRGNGGCNALWIAAYSYCDLKAL